MDNAIVPVEPVRLKRFKVERPAIASKGFTPRYPNEYLKNFNLSVFKLKFDTKMYDKKEFLSDPLYLELKEKLKEGSPYILKLGLSPFSLLPSKVTTPINKLEFFYTLGPASTSVEVLLNQYLNLLNKIYGPYEIMDYNNMSSEDELMS